MLNIAFIRQPLRMLLFNPIAREGDRRLVQHHRPGRETACFSQG